MHYADGTEVQVGDLAVAVDYDKDPVSGIVISVQPGAATCNMVLAAIRPIVSKPGLGQFVVCSDGNGNQVTVQAYAGHYTTSDFRLVDRLTAKPQPASE